MNRAGGMGPAAAAAARPQSRHPVAGQARDWRRGLLRPLLAAAPGVDRCWGGPSCGAGEGSGAGALGAAPGPSCGAGTLGAAPSTN